MAFIKLFETPQRSVKIKNLTFFSLFAIGTVRGKKFFISQKVMFCSGDIQFFYVLNCCMHFESCESRWVLVQEVEYNFD